MGSPSAGPCPPRPVTTGKSQSTGGFSGGFLLGLLQSNDIAAHCAVFPCVLWQSETPALHLLADWPRGEGQHPVSAQEEVSHYL